MKSIIIFILLSSLMACFPVYKTQKPKVEVTVVDEHGEPISNVKVMLMTEVHPAKIDPEYDLKMTNYEGQVSFHKQAEWKVESLLIHGMQIYNWNICVAKSGYLTQEFIEVDSDTKVKIVLKKGNNPVREFPCFC